MAWTVTKDAGAVSYSNWLAREQEASGDGAPVPSFYRAQEPKRLKRVVEDDPDPFAGKPTQEDAQASRASQFLGQSMGIYEDLLDRLPMMIFVVDGDGVLQNANRVTADLLGYPPETIRGKRMFTLLTEPSRDWLTRHVVPEYLKSGYYSNVDVQFLTRAGRTADFLMSAIGYRGPDGRIERSIVVFADMSERAAAVAALGRSERRIRSAFEAVGHGMAVLDPDGRFDAVNGALTEILGMGAEQLSSMRFDELLAPADRRLAQSLFERLKGPDAVAFERELHYRGAGERPVVALTSLSAVKDIAGRPEQFIVQLADVTHRDASELSRPPQRMEPMREEAAGIARDFGDLLTIVIGNLQLVEAALKGDEKAEKRAQEACLAAMNAAELTKRLAALARR